MHAHYVVTDDDLWSLFNEPDTNAFDRKLQRLDGVAKPRRGSLVLSAYLAQCQTQSHGPHEAYSLAYQIIAGIPCWGWRSSGPAEQLNREINTPGIPVRRHHPLRALVHMLAAMNRSNHRALEDVEAARERGDLISRSWLRAVPESDEELGQHWHVTRNGQTFYLKRSITATAMSVVVIDDKTGKPRCNHNGCYTYSQGQRLCPELHAVARFLATEQGVRDENKYKDYVLRWTSPAYRVDALDDARKEVNLLQFTPVLLHELRDHDREPLAPAPPPDKPAWTRRHRRQVSGSGRIRSRGEREQQEAQQEARTRPRPGRLKDQKARRDAAAAAAAARRDAAESYRAPGQLTATDMQQRENESRAAGKAARTASLGGRPDEHRGAYAGAGAQDDDGAQDGEGAHGGGDDDGDDGAREEVGALVPAQLPRRPRRTDTCGACQMVGHRRNSKTCPARAPQLATSATSATAARPGGVKWRRLGDPDEAGETD